MKDSYVFYKDKLNDVYKPVFEQVEMYVLTQNVDESALEERLSDLLDIFLSAQNAGKPPQKVVGGSIEQFCSAFCADFGIKNRILRLFDWLKSVSILFLIFSVIDILWFLLDGGKSSDLIGLTFSSLNITAYFSAAVIFDAVFSLINLTLRHMMFKTKKISMKVFRIVIWVEIAVSFIGIFLIVTLCKSNLFNAPTWVVALLSCLYLLIYYPIFGKRLKRRKIRISELAEENAQTNFSMFMEKRFEKEKKKNLKKGKGELTFEEYLNKVEKTCNRSENMKIYYSLLPIAITVSSYIILSLTDGFDSVVDSMMFVVFLLSAEYLVMWLLWMFFKSGIRTQREWIRAKREELKAQNKTENNSEQE